MTDFINQLPEEVYAIADDISLSDLLTFESTRHWAFSMISNASINQHRLPGEMEDEERLLMHNMLALNQILPHEVRMACFSKCASLVHQNRQNKRSQHNGE